MSYFDMSSTMLKQKEDESIRNTETARYIADLNYLARHGRAYAAGGPVEKDRPIVVGEKGPEIFVPEKKGKAIPNKNLSDLVPAGTGPETGTWEDLGGGFQLTAGDGTYNRPAHKRLIENPVQVIRGTRSTYAGGAPGQEWDSLQRAAQAIRRDSGQEEWVPPEQEMEVLKHKNKMEEIAASPQNLAFQQQKANAFIQQNTNAFLSGIYNTPGIGSIDKTGEFKFAHPSFEAIVKKHQAAAGKNPNAALQAATEELGRAQLGTEGNRAKMLANYRLYKQSRGEAINPSEEQSFLKGQITPENYRGLQGWLNYGAGKPAGVSAPRASEAPNLIDAATLLGSKMKYELSPPGTPGEKLFGPRGEAPTLQSIAAKRLAERKRIWSEESLPGRAAGGPVEEDQPYIIGEKGPEIFVPEKKGTVLPDLSALVPVQQSQYDEVALAGKG